ncbi:hypothetical protein BGX38DRAFT_1278090 [Terfezia claveryi]|nr:hypothetical protein BGX38DRAFT_1278090 [Terfezia claveryi]
MSSGTIPRLTALTRELEVAAFIIKELEMEVLIRERKDEALTLMEKLTDIQQRGEQELRELKDLLKHDESSAAVIQALEDLLECTGTTVTFIEGEIGKMA